MQEFAPTMQTTPDEQQETTARFGELYMKLAAVTLATAAVFAPQQLGEDTHGVAAVAGIEVPQVLLPQADTAKCPAPGPQALQAAQKLMDQPPNALDINLLYIDRAKFAKKSGMTVVPMNDSRLRRLYNYTDQHPFKDYFSVARQLFKQDGVTLRYATKADFKDDPNWKTHIPVPAELENSVAKKDILYTVNTLFTMPKEYVAFSGLKQVVITRNLGVAANAEIGGSHSRINIDLGARFDGPSGILNHEIGHLVQTAMCGSPQNVMRDPTYISLNKDIPYKNQAATFNMQPFSATDRMSAWAMMLAKNGVTQKDYSSLPRLIAAWNKKCQAYDTWQSQNKDVVFTDGYGATNKAEDEAQVLGALTQGFRQQIFDPEFPVLNQKATIELARLLQYGQVKTVKYLIKIMKIQGTIPSQDHMDTPSGCDMNPTQRTAYITKLFNSNKSHEEDK